MTPNLLVATQTLFSPHKWFLRKKTERSVRKTEQWDEPLPGLYEYIPGRGWYLVATGNPATEKVKEPVHVKYSKVLKRYMLQPDYDARKKYGKIPNSRGKPETVGFFRLDDIAWVQCWDAIGNFIPGPYQLWCIDQKTEEFRHMKKGDDPEYIHSRRNSATDARASPSRRSEESRSTRYRGEGGSKDPRSGFSSRANSERDPSTSLPASRNPSQPNTRPGSPKSIPLSEATTLLNASAVEQSLQASVGGGGGSAAGTSPNRGGSGTH